MELTASIDFLKTSTEDGTVKEDDKESMEVASASYPPNMNMSRIDEQSNALPNHSV
jgi:hypothetical protein